MNGNSGIRAKKMEPAVGFEPTTDGLQNGSPQARKPYFRSAFSTNFPQFKSFYNNSHGFMALRSKNQVIYNGQTENEGKR